MVYKFFGEQHTDKMILLKRVQMNYLMCGGGREGEGGQSGGVVVLTGPACGNNVHQ